MIQITNSGSHILINAAVGNNNVQKNSLNISKEKFSELKEYFLDKGICQEDLEELEVILKSDTPDLANKQFGKGVKAWMQNMLSKALDSSWAIGIEAAGAILSDGLKHYYGWFQ
jgi:hypothetical protein